MGLIVPDGYGVAKFRWRCQGDSEEMISTLGFAVAGDASAFQIATQVSATYSDSGWLPRLSADYTYVGCSVAIGPSEMAEVGEVNVNAVGGLAANSPPSNCALLVTKLTALGGKGNRGRMFLPAGHLQEVSLDANGILSSDQLAAAVTCCNDWFLAPQSAEYPNIDRWVLLHNGEGVSEVVLGQPTDISQFSVQPQIATQRQRMRR
jgi:hypothetical protein